MVTPSLCARVRFSRPAALICSTASVQSPRPVLSCAQQLTQILSNRAKSSITSSRATNFDQRLSRDTRWPTLAQLCGGEGGQRHASLQIPTRYLTQAARYCFMHGRNQSKVGTLRERPGNAHRAGNVGTRCSVSKLLMAQCLQNCPARPRGLCIIVRCLFAACVREAWGAGVPGASSTAAQVPGRAGHATAPKPWPQSTRAR